ncbi:MAG: alpha/beta fold hydrolase [Sphingomonas sp.]
MLAILVIIGIVALAVASWSASVSRRAEAMVPPDGGFVDVPGARLHFVDRGEGPAIVMVHGLMGQLRNFAGLADRMATDHRVILVDRPGWGHSSVIGKRPGIAAQAEAIAALIDKLGLDRPLVVGHSYGGAVSLALALAHPGRVRGLALIAPVTQPIATLPPVFRGLAAPAPLRPVLAWLLAVPMGVLSGRKGAAQVFAPDPVPADFAVRGGGALAVRPKSFLAGSHDVAVARAELEALAPRYGEIRVPVAILFGRADALLDPARNGEKTAAAIPGGSIDLIEGGHMPLVARADETAAWLRAVSARMG